jgi:hypothetical protein
VRQTTPCRSRTASSSSISLSPTALSGNTTTSTSSTSSRAAVRTRSTRSRSSRSEGTNSKNPNGSRIQPLHRSLHGAEVGLADPQRPRQQEQVDVLRPRVGPEVTGRYVIGQCADSSSRRACLGRKAREFAGMSEIRPLRGIDLTVPFCRAFPAPTVNQARLKIVVSPVRVRVSPSREAPASPLLPESTPELRSRWLRATSAREVLSEVPNATAWRPSLEPPGRDAVLWSSRPCRARAPSRWVAAGFRCGRPRRL